MFNPVLAAIDQIPLITLQALIAITSIVNARRRGRVAVRASPGPGYLRRRPAVSGVRYARVRGRRR